MIYNWDIKDLKKKRLILLKDLISKLSLSTTDRMLIKSDLNILNSMIAEIDVDKSHSIFTINKISYKDENEIMPSKYYDTFIKISPIILKILYPLIKEYDLIQLENDETRYFDFSSDEIIESSRDFYKSLPNKKYYKDLEKYLNPNNHSLYIKYGNLYTDESGITYNLSSQNKNYIIVNIINEITDLLTLDHELAHAYFFNHSTNIESWKTPYYYITEIEGLFFEYLKQEYLIKNTKYKDEINLNNAIKMNEIIEAILYLYIWNISVNQYSLTNKVDEDKILTTAINEGISCEYTTNIIHHALSSYPRGLAKECISYLTFLDLKNIAETDLEKALYLLEEIRKDYNPNVISTLRKNNITFMDDNYANFDKEYEKIKGYKI